MNESYQKDLLKNISTWFEILEEVSKNTKDTSSLPKLEVFLRSGRMFSGSVIGLQKSGFESLVMLLEQADLHSKSRVHLIQCVEVTAVTFVDPVTYLSIFSKEKTIISELELKRKGKIIEDEIERILSKRMPITFYTDSIAESDRSQVLQMIESFPKIFEELVKDDLGRKLISENFDNIGIKMGKAADTQLNGKQLNFIFEKDTAKTLSKQKEMLLPSIERLL